MKNCIPTLDNTLFHLTFPWQEVFIKEILGNNSESDKTICIEHIAVCWQQINKTLIFSKHAI